MKRIVWLDALKLIAIFMVICVHCSDPFNVSPEARYNQDYNFWGSLYGSFLRPCVPLFVMITGILLLPVKLPMKDFEKKIMPKKQKIAELCFYFEFQVVVAVVGFKWHERGKAKNAD